MKGLLCACLLVSLHTAAPAYEADIHFSTTYVLARAAGWTEADALTIASANQAMDENQDTVAALEADTTPSSTVAGYVMSSLRQAEKNMAFHCFSNTSGEDGRIAADVRRNIAGHFARVPGHQDDARGNTRRLIALGVALHCQQDAWSHVDFGGTCGSYAGSCYGHTHQTFLDQVVFGLLKKHHYNPDHPGVSGERLLEALQGTAAELAARRPGNAARAIPASALAALADGLRASGLELPDEVRRDCNRYIAGKWLHDHFQSVVARDGGTGAEKLAPQVARTCRNASLAAAAIIRIPEARYPRLDSRAAPYLVRADGTYEVVPGGSLEAASPGIHYHLQRARVQLSHWNQLLALPLATKVARLSGNGADKIR